jgi:hypothetical protein
MYNSSLPTARAVHECHWAGDMPVFTRSGGAAGFDAGLLYVSIINKRNWEKISRRAWEARDSKEGKEGELQRRKNTAPIAHDRSGFKQQPTD